MKDLEIRGAGNLLGAEQSGHIAAVGFELYSCMLEEAVAELRQQMGGERRRPSLPHPKIDLPVNAYLPQEYIPEMGTRLALYHRLAVMDNEEALADMEAELRDRFGPPPPQVGDLLYGARVRLLAAAAGVESVALEGRDVVVRLAREQPAKMQLLAALCGDGIWVRSRQLRLDMGRLRGRWRELLPEILARLGDGG
jgi:transcription-repair coupling factor (superfamily II helicase)